MYAVGILEYNVSGGEVLDRKTRDRIRSLDEFYLVEIIKDSDKFGYDDNTVRYAKRVLKRRGFTAADLERLYCEEVKPQDDLVGEKARELYFSFLATGKTALCLYCLFLAIFFIPLLDESIFKSAPDFFQFILLFCAVFFLAAPFVTVSRARKLSRLLLERYDDRDSQELFHRLDDSAWLLLRWYLFIPGFLISFYQTKKRLSGILLHHGFLQNEH